MIRPGRSALAARAMASLGLLALGGCARPFVQALPVPPYREQIPAPYDVTWKALVRALVTDNTPLRVVAKDSGVIASDDFVSPIGVYADCGRLGDALLEGDALVAFTVVAQANRDGTEVQLNAKMRTQSYRRGLTNSLRSEPVYPCASTGRWEANLGDTVRRLVRE
jgi:hypothetical protein